MALGPTPAASASRSAPCTATGYRTIGVANPLRALGSDAAYLEALLKTVEGPMVLVAHSYGGAVISNAATGNDQVKALVFLAGWALDEGESIEQLLGLNEGSLVLPALRQVPFTNPDGSEGVDLYLDQEAFPATFAGDVDPETARVMAATQRPWSARGAQRAVRAAGVEVDPLVVSARHRGHGDPSGDAALHGRARNVDNRGGLGLPCLDGFAAGRRDEADHHGSQRDRRRDCVGVAHKSSKGQAPFCLQQGAAEAREAHLASACCSRTRRVHWSVGLRGRQGRGGATHRRSPKKTSTSAANSSGCSQAAKWPPRSGSFQ